MTTKPAAPDILGRWLAPFEALFTGPTWRNLLVLLAGAILAPGRRTVTSALSILGLRTVTSFTNFHRVLNRNRWSSRATAKRLLHLLLGTFVPAGPAYRSCLRTTGYLRYRIDGFAIDDHRHRRDNRAPLGRQDQGPWHLPRPSALQPRPLRPSRRMAPRAFGDGSTLSMASGLRWISVMLLAPIPWAGRVWALPFLTALAPSARFAHDQGRRHKKLTDWARQLLILVARWLPERRLIAVADSSYAAIELLAVVRRRLTVITRLRLDARLFDPPPARRPGTIGRPRVSGVRQPTLAERLGDPRTSWRRVTVTGWYGRTERQIDLISGTALWYHPGKQVPIRWLLVRDVAGEFEPQGFLCTDPDTDPLDVLRWFVRRWSIEVTFAEVRRHLGVETQRQWSELAIARTTPVLLGLFSLVTLWAKAGLDGDGLLRRAAWYPKRQPSFSDALAAIRHRLWTAATFSTSPDHGEVAQIPRELLERLTQAVCFPA